MNERLLPWLRIGFAGLVVLAIVTQVANLVEAGVFNRPASSSSRPESF